MQHACAKCGCTVFTLEGPKSDVGGYHINTGIKLATCMECGCQDRPKEVEKMLAEDVEKNRRETAVVAEMKRRLEEEERYRCQPYRLLLAEWLKQFNKHAGVTNDRSTGSGTLGDFLSRNGLSDYRNQSLRSALQRS